jgi:hypothetical protein
MSEAPTTTTPHDANGRFAAGNRGGPGNPFARRVATLHGAFLDALTPQDMRSIALALLLKAQSGDIAAAKLLLQYSLGKPIAHVAPSGDGADDDYSAPVDEILPNLSTAELASLLEGAPQMPPRPMTKAERKAMYREMRRQRREKSPSPNGSIGAAATTSPSSRPTDARPLAQPLRAG